MPEESHRGPRGTNEMKGRAFQADELGLLADIHAAPRDDAPRLIYADWLQDDGQPAYAEFIRLQIEAERARADKTAAPRLSPREDELLGLHRDEWSRPRLKAAPGSWGAFCRGLPVYEVPLPCQDYRSRLSQLHRFGSPRHCLHLCFGAGDEETAEAAARHPLVGRVHRITVSCGWRFSHEATRDPERYFLPLLQALAASPRMAALECVSITRAEDSPGVSDLARRVLGASVVLEVG